MQGPRCALQTRILFHCAHQMGDEAKLMQHHQQLSVSTEDQLSLASIHYLRGHYQVGPPRFTTYVADAVPVGCLYLRQDCWLRWPSSACKGTTRWGLA